jgi:hypothetical protein
MPDARNDGKTTKRISAVVAGVVVSPDWLECTSLRDPRCPRPALSETNHPYTLALTPDDPPGNLTSCRVDQPTCLLFERRRSLHS